MFPEDWEIVKIGQVCAVTSGGTPSRSNPEFWGGNIPWVKTGEINYSAITDTEEKITQKGLSKSSAKLIPKDSILMAMYGQGITRGRVAVLRIEAAINQACLAILSSEKIYNYFLYHYLVFKYEELRDIGNETTQKNLNASLVKDIEILLPPIAEQKKIAEILGSVDEAIATTQAVIDQTRTVKQGLLQQLLTRGIGHTKFKETAIGLIPESWHIKTIKDLVIKQANSLTAGPFGTIFKAKDFRTEGVPIVQIRHVTEDGFFWGNKTTYMDEEVYKIFHQPYTVKGGDLLITKMGEPPGVACLYAKHEVFGMVTPDVIKAAIDPDKADTYFMMCLYNSPSMKKCILELTKGGTRARITLGEFYKLSLPIPPLKEQIEISEVLSGLDSEIQSEIKKLERCEEIKRGLMQDLLAGRVRVNC